MAAAPTPVIHDIHYRLRQGAAGRLPGAHRSRRGESGFEFRAHAPLIDAPDARRLDLHASLRDPFGQWQVRLNAQRMAVSVVVVADLSASMGFVGARRKADTLADLTQALAWSAGRVGDGFGFIGCDDTVRTDWLLPLTRQRGAGLALAERLRRWDPEALDARAGQMPVQGASAAAGHGADGLAQAVRWLPAARSLVFLVSDFHWPAELMDRVLAPLAAHEVVPVVLWDRAEFEPPRQTRWGHALLPLRDPETGRQRLVWWRPALQARWQALQAERRATLEAALQRHRLRAVWLTDGMDAARLNAHFVA